MTPTPKDPPLAEDVFEQVQITAEVKGAE